VYVYPWLGNVRELEGVIQRAVILASSSTLQPADIELASSPRSETLAANFFRNAKSQAVQQFERANLIDILAAHQGNVTRAAKSAGKERRAFQRLLRKHGLNRYAFQAPAMETGVV
jgi:two-component system response regulator GlrR